MAAVSSLLFGAALFGSAVKARVAPGSPAETFKPNMPFNGMSPMPTQAPFMPPSIRNMLEKRQQDPDPTLVAIAPDNTCGYVSGLSRAPFTCLDPAETCVLVSSAIAVPGVVGCCNGDTCGFRTACIDAAASSASGCGSDCLADSLLLKCTQALAPFCNSASFSGGAQDFFCGDFTDSTFIEVETTFSGQTGRTLFEVDLATVETEDTTSRALPVPTSSTSSQTSGTTSQDGVAVVTQTVTPDSDDDGPNVGAIVGGVVGGIAALALIGLLAWFLLRKKKNKPEAAPPLQPSPTPAAAPPIDPKQTPQPPQMYQTPPPEGYPPPSGPQQPMYYDPNNPNNPNPGVPANQGFIPYNPNQGYQSPPPVQYQTPPPGPGAVPIAGAAATGAAVAGAATYLANGPGRNDSTSPLSDFNRLSTQPPISPNSTGTPSFLPMQGVPPLGGQHAPVEAAGMPVGQRDYNGDHKGQMHELA